MYLLRGFTIWLVIIFAESIHGTIREIFLAPLIGDLPARRIAFFTGIILIFLIAYLFSNWLNADSFSKLLTVGGLWVILTVGFEFALGLFVLNYTLPRMLEDYDITRGGLMGFGLLFLLFAPNIADRLRRKKEFSKKRERKLVSI